jgi:lipopolysaccharide transport system ATP-binding protein
VGDPAIRVDGLSKSYILGERLPYKTIRETIARLWRRPVRGRTSRSEPFWAIRDVSLEVEHGQVLGIIGRNGAGKSTLLKILTRITEPTSGTARLRGRTASLLEVGTGFHPELTGRENIYLNGSILGMKRNEIDSRFDEIVDFSEIERFLDTPVKRYSSGMYVRLAFAVAAHLDPEILIVDEVLAVGDIAFQKKCLGKMSEAAGSGRTVLLVSHNLVAVESLCSQAILLDRGRVAARGPIRSVIESYVEMVSAAAALDLSAREDRAGDGALRFTSLELRTGPQLRRSGVAICGEDLEFVVGYTAAGTLRDVKVSIAVDSDVGQGLFAMGNEIVGTTWDSIASSGSFTCLVRRLPLAPGQYYLRLYAEVSGQIADWVVGASQLTVEPGDFYGTGKLPTAGRGVLLVTQEWAHVARDDVTVAPSHE